MHRKQLHPDVLWEDRQTKRHFIIFKISNCKTTDDKVVDATLKNWKKKKKKERFLHSKQKGYGMNNYYANFTL